jgi:hypothetical protein
MKRRRIFPAWWTRVLVVLWMGVLGVESAAAREFYRVVPGEVSLQGNFERAQLLVQQVNKAGVSDQHSNDLTHQASYTSSDPAIVTVDSRGQLLAVANGQAVIRVKYKRWRLEVAVTVDGVVEKPQFQFLEQITPILSKHGCNMGACHASQHGKGGFLLSIFGSDPDKDRRNIAHDRLQRRVDFIKPESSLLLLKPTLTVPHGGGLRLKKNSVDYQLLLAWLKAGAPGQSGEARKVTSLTVIPSVRVGLLGMKQQLRVEAQYSDGSVRDVTALARYDSMDEGMLSVDDAGLVSVESAGQGPVMVRFEDQAAILTISIPYSDSVELSSWTSNNFVDELAARKFQDLGIEPSGLCDDATFIRRAFLDAVGGQPTPEEVRAFLASEDTDKRARLVDQLLGLSGDSKKDIYNDRYAAFWTLKWSDLIRNNSNDLGEQGMWAMHNWIRESFRVNKPFDEFVSELVTAKGSIYMNGPANYFRVNSNATELTEATTQLFMGIRLECAKCHHHPFEKYSQADYYGIAAFFSRVGTKGSEEFGLFGREQVVVVKNTGDVNHPRTGKKMEPTTLDGEPSDHELDRRIPFAAWLTSKDNTRFASSVANRYVRFLLGRGLVEPVDDMRSTNPATNPKLLEALTRHFAENDFDLKQLLRVIMVSRLYQLDSQPTPENIGASRFYPFYRAKRLAAEPLLDAVDFATGRPTKFKNLPLGTRAIELPDAEYPNYFLNTFAKPRRVSVCECERTPDENLAQALHTLNGDILSSKIADSEGRIAKMLEQDKEAGTMIEEIYLATVCRIPSGEEMQVCLKIIEESPSPKEGYEDLMWALINSKDFLYVK